MPTYVGTDIENTTIMITWLKRKNEDEKRSLEQLSKQLKGLDKASLAGLRGGRGKQKASPKLQVCGGWLPQ